MDPIFGSTLTTKRSWRYAFTDCPTREQRAWVGDEVVHQMMHLVR
jgi:alpha-L-rhamnosidase